MTRKRERTCRSPSHFQLCRARQRAEELYKPLVVARSDGWSKQLFQGKFFMVLIAYINITREIQSKWTETLTLRGLRARVRLPRMQTKTPIPKQQPKPLIRVLMDRLEASRAWHREICTMQVSQKRFSIQKPGKQNHSPHLHYGESLYQTELPSACPSSSVPTSLKHHILIPPGVLDKGGTAALWTTDPSLTASKTNKDHQALR